MGSHFLDFCMLSDVRFYLGYKYLDYSLEYYVLETGLCYIAPKGVDTFVLVGNQPGHTQQQTPACSGRGSSVSCRFRLFKHRMRGLSSLCSSLPLSWRLVCPGLLFLVPSVPPPRGIQAAVAAPVPLCSWLYHLQGKAEQNGNSVCVDCFLQVMSPPPKCVFQSSETSDSFLGLVHRVCSCSLQEDHINFTIPYSFAYL